MEPFPVLAKAELDPAQRALWDELTLGPRGFYTGGEAAQRLPDLYNAWLQFPEFGELMLRLGDAVRDRPDLPGKARELIVLTTSARLGALVEFDFHVPFALNEGLAQEAIDALRNGASPEWADDLERTIHAANVQLLDTATMTAETREEVVGLVGFPGLVQLIATVTLYVVTAYTTNVARVRLAEDFSADPEELKTFFAGRRPDAE